MLSFTKAACGLSLAVFRIVSLSKIYKKVGWPTQTLSSLWQTVALWGQAAKADESVLARNQTKDSWTWNLAVSGSGKGTRTRVDDATQREARTRERQLEVGHRRAERQAAEVGVEERRGSQHRTPSREAMRQDRVQWRRVSRCLIVALWNFR